MLKKYDPSMKLLLSVSISFFILIILFIYSSLFQTNSLHHSVTRAKEKMQESRKNSDILVKMKFNILQIREQLLDASTRKGRQNLDSALMNAKDSKASFSEGLASMRSYYNESDHKQGLMIIEEIKNDFEIFYNSSETMAKAYINGDVSKGNQLNNRTKEKFENIKELIDLFLEEVGIQSEIPFEIIKEQSFISKSKIQLIIFAVIFSMVAIIVITKINQNHEKNSSHDPETNNIDMEIEQLEQGYKDMFKSLRNIINKLNNK